MSRSAVEVLLDADCSSIEKLVLQAIARHGRREDGSGGYPNVRRIALIAGTSRSTVQRTVSTLRAKGWLSWNPGQGRTANTYTLHLDAIPKIPNLWRSVPTTGTQTERSVPTIGTKADAVVSHADAVVSQIGGRSVPTVGPELNTEVNTKEKERESALARAKENGADAPSLSPDRSASQKPNGKADASAEQLSDFVAAYQQEQARPGSRLEPCSGSNAERDRKFGKLISEGRKRRTPFSLERFRAAVRKAASGPDEWYGDKDFDWFIDNDNNIERVLQKRSKAKPARVVREMPSFRELARRPS